MLKPADYLVKNYLPLHYQINSTIKYTYRMEVSFGFKTHPIHHYQPLFSLPSSLSLRRQRTIKWHVAFLCNSVLVFIYSFDIIIRGTDVRVLTTPKMYLSRFIFPFFFYRQKTENSLVRIWNNHRHRHTSGSAFIKYLHCTNYVIDLSVMA